MAERFHEKFNDPMKAVCYLGAGLAEDFPNAVTEAVFRWGPRMRLEQCRTRDIVGLLEVMCRKFPRTSVDYDPEADDGVIAELRCHCTEEIKLKCCHHRKDRPHVTVRLISIGDTQIADGEMFGGQGAMMR